MATTYTEFGTGKQVADVAQLDPSTKYVESGTGKTALGSQFINPNIPASQTPITPAPQIQSPPVPFASGSQTPTQPQAQQPQLTMPMSGSVVDLLNMAGQDSSKESRAALAKQYGIQNYDFSAAKNKELADRFIEAYNQAKGKPIPQSGAQAASDVASLLSTQTQTQQDTTKSFMDIYGSMNPIEANLFQQLSGALSSQSSQQTLTEFFQQELQAQGIPEFQMELADVNRIIDGTEDDIRAEITNSGGFATESQVQALTNARNKTLLKRASYLSNILAAKNDYVDRIVSLTQADREQVSKDLDRKLGITQTLFNMSQSMTNAARENLNNFVSNVGYAGLAEVVSNSPEQQTRVENILGLPKGSLSNQAFIDFVKPKQKLVTQITEIGGRRALLTYDQTGNPVNLVDIGSAGSSDGDGLTSGQMNAFNSIVSKYNASPLIAAADRTIVLKNTIDNIREDPSNGAQQLNLAYSYIQALDTYQSAVREGELSLVNSIDSRIGQIRGEVEKIQNGQIVRPQVALNIANAAEDIVNTINQAAALKAQSYESQANVVGLGKYWNQYVSGFQQSYNKTTNTKGNLSNSEFVERILNERGISYLAVLEDIPFGQIGVIENDTGELGSIPPDEFDSSIYTKI